jgi:DNA polymerase-3 subunit epsilon
VDNSGRKQHGALLDAQLLAEVYLAMTRGQDSLVMEVETTAAATVAAEAAHGKLDLVVIRASKDELAAHARLLEEIDKESKGATLWRKLEKA